MTVIRTDPRKILKNLMPYILLPREKGINRQQG
jgi:hypothetical protein